MPAIFLKRSTSCGSRGSFFRTSSNSSGVSGEGASGWYLTATLSLGEQAAAVAGDHGVEVVDRRGCPGAGSVDHAIGNERPLEPLEHPPSDGVMGECRRRTRSGLVGDRSPVRRFHVDFGHPFGHHEPSERFLHRAAHREQAVVAQDAEFLVAECRGDAPAAIWEAFVNNPRSDPGAVCMSAVSNHLRPHVCSA